MKHRFVKIIFCATLLFGFVFTSQAFADPGFPPPPIGKYTVVETE